jgi:hypothetical protein
MFDDYWKRLEDSTPTMKTAGNMRITVSSFKDQMRKAFAAGQESMRDVKSAADAFGKVGRPENPFGDLFGGIFG